MTPRAPTIVLLVLLAVGFLAAGCGDGGGETTGESGTSDGSASATYEITAAEFLVEPLDGKTSIATAFAEDNPDECKSSTVDEGFITQVIVRASQGPPETPIDEILADECGQP